MRWKKYKSNNQWKKRLFSVPELDTVTWTFLYHRLCFFKGRNKIKICFSNFSYLRRFYFHSYILAEISKIEILFWCWQFTHDHGRMIDHEFTKQHILIPRCLRGEVNQFSATSVLPPRIFIRNWIFTSFVRKRQYLIFRN
jgi:hypothetical protein